jgi:hypothetical protein
MHWVNNENQSQNISVHNKNNDEFYFKLIELASKWKSKINERHCDHHNNIK